jgi:hypothetical protein
VPPSVIKTRLIQAGNAAAAARDGEWDRDYWRGIDTEGRLHTVRTLGYRDHDWHAAHQAVVKAELVQAVGRARSICEHGIPVVVLTDEELGLPLRILAAPQPNKTADPVDMMVLRAMRELSDKILLSSGAGS